MNALFHAHSGLRYVVLLFALVNIVVLAIGIATKKPFGKLHRALGASFAGTLHLQVIIGVAVALTRQYYPALIGHFAMMFMAAGVAQACMSINRRKPQPTLTLPLIGIVIALALICGGIMAIQRGILQSTAF